MRLSTKVAYNTIIQIVSKVIATGLGLLSVAILTRYLGQAGFGKYTTIMAFLSFFGIIADLGLTLITAQMVSQDGVDKEKVLNNLFSLRVVSAVFFLSLAPLAVIFFPYDADVKTGVAIGSISFVFVSLNQVLVGFFQNKLRMDKVSIAEVVGRSALLVGIAMVAYMKWGLLGAMWATVISNVLNFVLHFSFARKFSRIGFDFDFSYWKEIIKKSWPLATTIVLNLIYLKGDTLILSLAKSQEAVGIYGASYKVVDVLVMIPFVFSGIILPILTSSWIRFEMDYFKRVLQKGFNFMMILAVPLVVGSQFLAGQIMELVAGKEFTASGNVLKVLILACFFVFVGVIFSHVIVAIDKQRKLIGAYVFTSITTLIGYIFVIPKFSYIGAAWMTVYSEALIAIFVIYYVRKLTNFLPSLVIFFKSLACALLMGLGLYFVPVSFYANFYGLFITLGASVIAYFVLLYLMGGITKQDIMDVLNK